MNWYVADGDGVWRFTGATLQEARHKAMRWMERRGFFGWTDTYLASWDGKA